MNEIKNFICVKRKLFAAALVFAAFVWGRLIWMPSPSGQVIADYGGDGNDGLDKEEGFLLEEGETYTATGRVVRTELHSAGTQEQWWVILDSVSIQKSISIQKNTAGEIQDSPAADISGRLICRLDQPYRPRIGALVQIRGQFSYFSQARNPGEFDSAEYYRISGIGGTLKKAELLEESREYSVMKESLWQLQDFWKKRLYRLFPGKEASILCTMLLGDKTSLDSELKELYKRNGIVHILSISGLHITMIGMGIYKLLRRTGCSVFPAALTGSAVLIFYGLLTGMGISACRAIGMYLIRMLGELLGRSYDMLTALGFMGILMLLRQPEYLRHSGFLLSFGSVCGIGLLLPVLQGKEKPGKDGISSFRRPFALRLRELLAPGLAITIFTLPVHLCFYYEIPVYSLFLNLMVLPFMGVVMGTGLTAMLLPDTLLPLARASAAAGCLVLGGYERLCGLFDRLPFHTWRPGCPQSWQVIAFYALMAVYILAGGFWKKREPGGKRRMKRYEVCLWAIPAAAVLLIGIRFHADLEVTFLDVGQGDGIFVRTNAGETYLFDCGSSSEQQIGKYTLIPFLKYQGVSRIDAVFISHPDADHYNGILELLEQGPKEGIRVERIFLPDVAEERRKEDFSELTDAAERYAGSRPVKLMFLSKGDAWKSGETVFTCLHPGSGSLLQDTNEYSLCFLLSQGSFSMLFTGDVQGEGEEQLLKTLQDQSIQNISVLKVAHHGSRNSTPEELLRLLKPRLAVISCGEDNSYGHPHPELMERLNRAGCRIYMTPQTGALSLRLRSNRLTADAFLPLFS